MSLIHINGWIPSGKQHPSHFTRDILVYGHHKVPPTLHFPQAGQSCFKHVVVPHYFHTFSWLGNLVCGNHSVLLVLDFFPGGRAPFESPVAPHLLHTFSGQSIPTGRDWSILLSLHSLQNGEGSRGSHLCVQTGEKEAAPCWINLLVKGPLVCMLWNSPIYASFSSSRGG